MNFYRNRTFRPVEVERKRSFRKDKAIVRVQGVRRSKERRTVRLQVEISPDGINWIDHEGQAPLVTEAVGLLSIPVERFGHWLRLRTEQASGTDAPMLRIYLELKE